MWVFLALAVTLASPLAFVRRGGDATKPGWHPEPRGWTKRSMERPPRPLLRGELTADWWSHSREALSQDVWASARAELDRRIEVRPFRRDIRRREYLLRYLDGRQSLDHPPGDPRVKRRPRYAPRHGLGGGFREGAPDNHSLAP